MLTLALRYPKDQFSFPPNTLQDLFLVCVCCFSLNFRHCNYAQYYNDSMSNLHDNYDLKIIPSKILIPDITAAFSPFEINGWKRISKPGGTSALSSVNT